jgi:peptide methionine sulfoxide reductase MsrB
VELSKETLEILQDYARHMVTIEEAALLRYRSGEMLLSYQVRRAGAYVLTNVYENVLVKPGDRYDSIRGIPSYDDLLASLIQESEIRLGQMRRAEARAKYRIGVWELGTLKEIK